MLPLLQFDPNNSFSSIIICHHIRLETMLSDMQAPDNHPTPDSFRPAKRRRFYRKRNDTNDDEASDASALPAVAVPELQTVDELLSQNGQTAKPPTLSGEEDPLSVADLIRQRKAIQRRRGGIEFTNMNSRSPKSALPEASGTLVEKDDSADIKSVIGRFAPQTGQVSETTDKHMYGCPSLLLVVARRSD